jgi:truncated hemoglobin YjbI
MEIARERFLDASRDYHLTLGLRSRTAAMHSALTALTPEERAQVALAMAHALDEIERIVRPHVTQPGR